MVAGPSAPAQNEEHEIALLERAILQLLEKRKGTLCPSEAARTVGGDGWRGLMELTRKAGRRLAARGLVRIMQGGATEDPGNFVGAIRFGRGCDLSVR